MSPETVHVRPSRGHNHNPGNEHKNSVLFYVLIYITSSVFIFFRRRMNTSVLFCFHIHRQVDEHTVFSWVTSGYSSVGKYTVFGSVWSDSSVETSPSGSDLSNFVTSSICVHGNRTNIVQTCSTILL